MVEANRRTYFKNEKKIEKTEVKVGAGETKPEMKEVNIHDIETQINRLNVNRQEYQENDQIRVYEKWEEYNLKDELLRGIYAVGFDTPSYIQKTAIAPIIQRRNLRAQAQSGTGKTAAFGIGSLQRLSGEKRTEVLILVNTREMAEQNSERIKSIAQYMNIDVLTISGGSDVRSTAEALRRSPEIVVGTPGRIAHMINDGHLACEHIDLIVIDEADELLNEGFKDKILELLEHLSAEAQIVMFSATWDKPIAMIADEILEKDALIVDLRHDEQTLKGIDQYYVDLGMKPYRNSDSVKLEALLDIYQKNEVAQCIVFVNTRRTVRYLHTEFTRKNIPCDFINADLVQAERAAVLKKFINGSCRLLIATGLIGRGIDIQHLSLVINFDMPPKSDKSNYIHRIGRAGRYGRKGKALNLVFSDEMDTLKEIERHFATNIEPLPGNMDLR